MTSPPTRAELRARNLLPYRSGRNSTKADIFLWDAPGGRLAIKDYARRPAWIRMTLGRLPLSRECAAYQRLQAIPGIPPFAGRVDAWAFAIAFAEGTDLSRLARGTVPGPFFTSLLALLDTIHSAGVAQGDLHHRDVILGRSGQPILVDFSTAAFRPSNSRGLREHFFQAACNSDRRAALKLKQRHVPGDLTDEERRILDHPPAWYRMGKAMRRWIPGARENRQGPASH